MDNNLENAYEKTFNIIEHVKENLLGFVLLFFAFFIIYFIDYINRLNIILYSTPSQIHGLSSVAVASMSKRKFKKR
jgi:hypothetical protein